MLEFASANQQFNADSCDEFEFMMPIGAASSAGAGESFREIEDYSLSPADELFYKGQLLPLLLPCRLKMVQELCTSEIRPSKSEDADPDVNNAAHSKIPRSSANHHVELPSKVPCFSARCSKEVASAMFDNLGEPDDSMQNERSSTNITVPKPKLRWKVLFRRGKKCSLVEVPCCHFTRSGSGIRSETPNVGYIGIESYASAFRRSGSCNGSPKRPRHTMSSLSSSALIHRNPSINSRSLRRDKSSMSAMRVVASTTKAQKESLVLRARDCLQRSLKVLKLARFTEQKGYQHRSNLLKQQHDYQCIQNTHVTKKRSQVAHCEHSNSSGNGLEDENVCSETGMPAKSLSSPKDDSYWDLHLAELNVSKRSWASSLFADEEEDEHSNAAFITIEPTSPDKVKDQCNNPSSDLNRPASSLALDSPSNNCRPNYLEVHDSIQGAIAHCKASV